MTRELVHLEPKLNGAEFRFLRVELDLSQKRLAEMFGCDAQSVALREERRKAPIWADRFLRALWRAISEGNAPLREIVGRFADLGRQEVEWQEFEEREGEWHPRLAA